MKGYEMPPVYVPKNKLKEFKRRENIGCLILCVVSIILWFLFEL